MLVVLHVVKAHTPLPKQSVPRVVQVRMLQCLVVVFAHLVLQEHTQKRASLLALLVKQEPFLLRAQDHVLVVAQERTLLLNRPVAPTVNLESILHKQLQCVLRAEWELTIHMPNKEHVRHVLRGVTLP